MKIKNIVFDFGGVLLTEDDIWLHSNETKNLLNIFDSDKLVAGWRAAWPDARDGKTSEDEFFSTFLTSVIGKPNPGLISNLKNLYRKKANTFTAFPVLKPLKNNYKIYAIPNITKDWLEYKIQKFSLNDQIDLIVSSCNEAIAKPNKEIFLRLINKTKINPSETFFVDNMEKNILPATEIGFKTHLYKDLTKLKTAMTELGIIYD